MAKTSLVYIDEAAGEAIARERETPTLPPEIHEKARRASLQVIAGFKVVDVAAEGKVVDENRIARAKRLDGYCRHREEVRQILGKIGIRPLSILPKTAWNRICAESGLIRLFPNKDGSVLLSDSIVRNCREFADCFGPSLLVLITAAVCIASGTYGFIEKDYPWWGAAITGVIWGFFSLILFGLILIGKESYYANWIAPIGSKLFFFANSLKPWKKQLETFFPSGASIRGISSNTASIEAKIILPDPPTDVQEILLRSQDLNLCVAATAEAIRFSEVPGVLFGREYARRVKSGEYADPIIFLEHGEAIAVIAQFGDFPVEREVVHRVMNSEHLF